jgi:hypothetical protein
MKKSSLILFWFLVLAIFPSLSSGKELPKVAVWDLVAGNIDSSYAQVYSQENVRTLAGWTAERMQLGCTDTKCLTALGQMDIARLISGRVGKIGNRFSVSLSLFDTQNAIAENMISRFCQSEDELIELVQVAVRTLLKEEQITPAKPFSQKAPVDLGMSVQEITPEMARQLRLKATGGVIVTQVESGSPADETGLQRGDVIQEINRQAIRKLGDYQAAIGKVKKDEVVRLLVKRGERNIYLAFRSKK